MTIKDTIKEHIDLVLKKEFGLENVEYQIDYPPDAKLGDYSCNVAMGLAHELKKKPIEIGEKIVKGLRGLYFEKIEVVAPGFINFFLKEEFLNEQVEYVLKQKEKYGSLKNDKAKKVQIEFISANPTGPLTLANGRGGFTGDVLANILSLVGHDVQREYYINDYGNQVRILGHSVLKDEEAEYKGSYIDELSKKLDLSKEPFDVGLDAAAKIVDEYIKPAVAKMKIDFDVWFSERKMHENGEVEKMLEKLKKKELVFESDGAVWLKTAEAESSDDDKDRVLVKSSGDKTYFLGDIAYHFDKFKKRGFDKVIDIWGADHHGYVPRLKHAVGLIGYPGQLDIILMQLVRLIKDGQEFKMSKRKGDYVLIEELIAEVGLDVTRFFFLMHAANRHMDFDLDLAKEKSSKNPVFYIQYAHARICSILDKARDMKKSDTKQELVEGEKGLIKELIKWPEIVKEVAGSYEVHRVAFYAISLADRFHDFYENCRVIEEDEVIESRLRIIEACKQVLGNVLDSLGVSAPEKM